MRIVSLLPSATEIVCALGLGEQLVGVTHECDYPPCVRQLPKVTRTHVSSDSSSKEIDQQVRSMVTTQRSIYSLDQEILAQLQPDLIITQALCDVCAVAEDEVLTAVHGLPKSPRVVNLEPTRLSEVFESLQIVADAAGVSRDANQVIASLQQRVDHVVRQAAAISRPRVVMLEWIDPLFCAGHWSPELIRLAGGREMIGREARPSRRISWEEVQAADPELLFIACCGFQVERTMEDMPLLRSKPGFDRLACVRNEQVHVFDGSAYFNRPGPRLVDSLEMIARIIASAMAA